MKSSKNFPRNHAELGLFLKIVLGARLVVEARCLNYANIRINIDDIRQERSNEDPVLKLNNRLK